MSNSCGSSAAAAVRVVASALVVAGALCLVQSSRLQAPPAMRVVGGNRAVEPGAVDPLVVTAQNSPVVVVNPTDANNLVVVSRVDLPRFECGVHVSLDGGSSFRETPLPISGSCFAPDAAFGPDGTLFVAFTIFSASAEPATVPGGLWVSSSGDGGRSLGAPVLASGPLAFQARLAADPARPGRLFLTWVQAADTSGFGFASSGNPVVMSRSEDGGSTWTRPRPINPATRARVVAPVPLSTGEAGLVVAYLDVGDDRLDYHGAHGGRGGEPFPGLWQLVAARSVDGGQTWHESVVDAGVTPAHRFLQLSPPTPSLAADGRHLYAAFSDGRAGDADVWLWHSTDAGGSWGQAERVNDTPLGDGRSQHLPALAVAPGGRVDVVYYDRRGDPEDVLGEVSLQSSFDRGHSFTTRVGLADQVFDSRRGLGSDRGMADLGSRLGVVATDRGTLAVWSDTRHAAPGLDKQLLVQAVVAVSRPAPAGRVPLGAAGLVALAAGLAWSGALVRRGSTRGPRQGLTPSSSRQQPSGPPRTPKLMSGASARPVRLRPSA